MRPSLPRTRLSTAERSFRSRIAQLATAHRLLRGTLSVRSRTCGKPSCRCASGKLHSSLYLVHRQGGQLRQIFVPKEWEERVRQAVSDYQKMQQLIEEVSEQEWKRLERRKE